MLVVIPDYVKAELAKIGFIARGKISISVWICLILRNLKRQKPTIYT